ncbi:MAG: T9SS type A sorting domain-containing protein [Bacteroidia bacterium]|nr:T9SS type A sorting domain-containing protein [Bacteroidia bacterium]
MGNTLRKIFSTGLLAAAMTCFTTASMAVNATVMGNIPSAVNECSGMDYTGGASFWIHNDGWGDNHLYKVNNSGNLSRTVTVLGATNNDWEDVCHDAGRVHLFIGDIGNNDCDRTNLVIYRVPYPSFVSGTEVTAEAIHFSYPDQQQFPSPWMNYDCEAFTHFNGNLYLFTKADGDAVGYTKMYRVPDVPGNYVATLVDSFYTNDRTTSADISPDGSTLILIANSRIHLFRNFQGNNFFNGQHTLISISGGWTQKEGVAFWTNNEIYLSDEDNGNGNHLYYIDMSPWIPSTSTTGISQTADEDISAGPNPSISFFGIQGSSVSTGAELQLFDITGKMIRSVNSGAGRISLVMETADIPAGVYFYKLIADNRELRTSRLIVSH